MSFCKRDAYNKSINRFISKIKIDSDGCWIWDSWRHNKGYGLFKFLNRAYKAHRFSYEYFVGEIPEHLIIDHMCHNNSDCLGGNNCKHRACVNPDHLEPSTNSENSKRGHTGEHHSKRNQKRIYTLKTVCKYGHSLSGENRVVYGSGKGKCRLCKNRRLREARLRAKLQSA